MNKQKGFTIIELIIVIAIIAILASIIMINVSGYLNKAKDAAIQSDMHTIQTAIISLNAQNGGTWTQPTTADYTNAVAKVNSSGGTYTEYLGTGTAVATFCAKTPLPSAGTTWCIDSTGYAGTLGTGKCTGVTATTCQ